MAIASSRVFFLSFSTTAMQRQGPCSCTSSVVSAHELANQSSNMYPGRTTSRQCASQNEWSTGALRQPSKIHRRLSEYEEALETCVVAASAGGICFFFLPPPWPQQSPRTFTPRGQPSTLQSIEPPGRKIHESFAK